MHDLCCPGPRNRHVQAHEPTGRPEDHGGNQEGDELRCPAPGQLLRQNTGPASILSTFMHFP